MKYFFSKCDQIRIKIVNLITFTEEIFMENFIFCAVRFERECSCWSCHHKHHWPFNMLVFLKSKMAFQCLKTSLIGRGQGVQTEGNDHKCFVLEGGLRIFIFYPGLATTFKYFGIPKFKIQHICTVVSEKLFQCYSVFLFFPSLT